MRKRKTNGLPARAAIASALCIALISAFSPFIPSIMLITQKAAMLSAAVSMPEGTINALRERFSGDLEGPGPASRTPEQSSAPSPGTGHSPLTSEDGQPEPDSSAPPSSKPTPARPPDIPDERRRPILSENMSGFGNTNYLRHGEALVRNETRYSFDDIKSILEQPLELELASTDEPQVLIIHTHATEAYTPFDMDYYDTEYTWRTTDNNENIIAVGKALAEAIESHGIGVIHDKTLHDYPSYNGGYERSAATVEGYLEKYPSIKAVFDVHRDAIERSGEVIVKPTIEIEGQKAAQLMIISCADNGSIGIPNWDRNLRFAAAITSAANGRYPGIMRPIFLCHRKYNQHLSDGSLLLEFGTHASTLDEALHTARLTGDLIGDLLKGAVSG